MEQAKNYQKILIVQKPRSRTQPLIYLRDDWSQDEVEENKKIKLDIGNSSKQPEIQSIQL